MTCEGSRAVRIARSCIILVLFGSFFLSYTGFRLWDYDFWWHLATGRYIVAENHLPDKDPFSLTSNVPENRNPFPEQESFTLKQSWLADSLFYLIYSSAGPQGIIFLRAILLVLTLLVTYRHMSRSGVLFFVSVIFTFLLFQISLKYTAERPVLFTFLFTAVVFSILDGFKKDKGKKLLFLIPLMLLWANIHGGFIIGDIFLLIFMSAEAVKMVLKRSDYSIHERMLFFSVSTAAVVASFINPAGLHAFWFAVSPKYAILKQNIQEWQSPFYLIADNIYPASNYYPYFFVLALFPLLLLLRNKKMDISHIILVSLLWYESVRSLRLVILFMIPAVVVAAHESSSVLRPMTERRWSRTTRTTIGDLLTLATVCVLIYFMFFQINREKLIANDINHSALPASAVDFLQNNRIEGNLFNEYAYGGYISWRLYPWKKNFIDSRALNIVVMKENDMILSAGHVSVGGAGLSQKKEISLYERLLDQYRIHILLFSPIQMYGDITPLILKLMDDNTWAPVFCDPISVIYLKNVPENLALISKFRITDDAIYNSIIVRSSLFAIQNNANPRPLLAMGEVFYRMGRLEDSLKAYQYSLKRDPANAIAKEMTEKIRSDMKQKQSKRS